MWRYIFISYASKFSKLQIVQFAMLSIVSDKMCKISDMRNRGADKPHFYTFLYSNDYLFNSILFKHIYKYALKRFQTPFRDCALKLIPNISHVMYHNCILNKLTFDHQPKNVHFADKVWWMVVAYAIGSGSLMLVDIILDRLVTVRSMSVSDNRGIHAHNKICNDNNKKQTKEKSCERML